MVDSWGATGYNFEAISKRLRYVVGIPIRPAASVSASPGLVKEAWHKFCFTEDDVF